jgi:hypothetical protein
MRLREASWVARTAERFARNERLGDLSFELDAMGTVFGHGFQSPAVSVNPNLNLSTVRATPNLQSIFSAD